MVVCCKGLYMLADMKRPARKTNIVDSALNIDPDQPKHAAQVIPGRHFSRPVDFLFQVKSHQSLLNSFYGSAVTCN